ncbi:RNA-guided endonuclease TnpB family protein [Aneurinibacillus sp. Ricciae_BoGa-3]|uniref:RNA-guided endonuclease InsQ/TnpB family protein n=1 Tax=Aneurinibacillus sp. Ricciae_BoGa-3 TaxID=3022697 RepID=UPI00234134A0|nr:RNA-guided endonuclease TnpB family protein [Aneurinibacillus sp. Ricciae_BoGa-3]WCK54304.1 RNA-guided endonuclease TnpB family protein [Aneurinibacillus sp. Ricciae_BoGa-3]
MKKAYKTEIILNEKQCQKAHQTLGVCRYVYNLYLSTNKAYYEKEKKFLSGMDFSKWLNNEYTKEKDQWIKLVSSKAVKQAVMNGEKAFIRFFKGWSKFPKFKKKKNQDVKAYFPKNNPTDWTVERHRIKIPTLGWVRLKEYGYIPDNAKVSSGTISYKAGRFFVSVLCEVEFVNSQINPHVGVGVDVGVKHFAVCSNHTVFKNINYTTKIKKVEKSLKRQQRKLSRKYEYKKKRGEPCYKNIQKQIAMIQKLHVRLANIREEYVRYVVNALVKAKPKYITIEDLNVKGLMKNRHLADSIRKQKFYRFKEWLTSKCNEYGIELRMVSRFYPSSKACSCCGYKKNKLSLSERIFKCDSCGVELDRDFNASLNLKNATEYTFITRR